MFPISHGDKNAFKVNYFSFNFVSLKSFNKIGRKLRYIAVARYLYNLQLSLSSYAVQLEINSSNINVR